MLYTAYYVESHDCQIEFDSNTRKLKIWTKDYEGTIQYTNYKLRCVTMQRLSKAYPEMDEEELHDELLGQQKNYSEEDGDDEELQLLAFTVIIRKYGTAFTFE